MSFVNDSWITKVTYREDKQQMEIIMNGTAYLFCNVPLSIYNEFKESDSRGEYYNDNIKGNYDC